MPLTREIRIIKVPLSDKERLPDYKPSFPKTQRLYLELLENKAKIKQDLINKEYIPKDINSSEHIQKQHSDDKLPKHSENKPENKAENDSDTVSISSSSSESTVDGEKDKYKEDMEIDEDPKHSRSESVESNDSDESQKSDKSGSIRERHSKDTDDGGDDLSDRLKELLGDTDDEKSRSSSSESDKYDKPDKRSLESRNSKYTPYDKYKQMREQANPPTLAELEAKGQYQGKSELRDINHIAMSEHEAEDKKRELIFKFNILKKSYPLAASTIPEYTIHADLREMQKSYDDTVRRLSLDSSVESYKSYLIGGFMLVEYVFGGFLGFDMQGFTQQQIIGMHNYEKLLIELGEKSYVPSGSKWPVELRLVFVIILNAGFFIVSKMIMRKTGANLMNMFNNMNQPNTGAAPAQPRSKRRMKGPNIDIDEIPDADDQPENKAQKST